MYAVIQIGSSQYKISEGDRIQTHLLKEEEGKKIVLEKVLLVSNDSEVRVGQPFLKGIKVEAEVIRHFKGEKTLSFKFRRRKNYSKKRGYRQRWTELSVKKISA